MCPLAGSAISPPRRLLLRHGIRRHADQRGAGPWAPVPPIRSQSSQGACQGDAEPECPVTVPEFLSGTFHLPSLALLRLLQRRPPPPGPQQPPPPQRQHRSWGSGEGPSTRASQLDKWAPRVQSRTKGTSGHKEGPLSSPAGSCPPSATAAPTLQAPFQDSSHPGPSPRSPGPSSLPGRQDFPGQGASSGASAPRPARPWWMRDLPLWL